MDEMSHLGRGIVGAFGGAAAVISKYLGQDHAYYLRLLDLGDQQIKIDNLWLGYKIMGPSLIFLGALVAWASYENHRLKLLAMAIAAPALITTWAGGATAGTKIAMDFFATPAAAADVSLSPKENVSVGNAIKLFFGVGKDEERYTVLVGPYKSENEAHAVGAKIRRDDPNVPVFVAQPDPKTGSTFLAIGNSLPYPEAKILRDKAKDIEVLKDKDFRLSANPPIAPAMKQ